MASLRRELAELKALQADFMREQELKDAAMGDKPNYKRPL